MRNIRTTAMLVGICALSFCGPLAGAELHGKIDNVAKLNLLELRTQFAAGEGPILPEGKGNHRTAETGDASPDAPSLLNILRSDLHAVWDLVPQQSQLSVKFSGKHLDPRPADRTSHHTPRDWQYGS